MDEVPGARELLPNYPAMGDGRGNDRVKFSVFAPCNLIKYRMGDK